MIQACNFVQTPIKGPCFEKKSLATYNFEMAASFEDGRECISQYTDLWKLYDNCRKGGKMTYIDLNRRTFQSNWLCLDGYYASETGAIIQNGRLFLFKL